MTTAISIEDVRREVKILKSLSGHKHLVKFHDACEDANNVYIVMEYVFYLFLFLIILDLKNDLNSCLPFISFMIQRQFTMLYYTNSVEVVVVISF